MGLSKNEEKIWQQIVAAYNMKDRVSQKQKRGERLSEWEKGLLNARLFDDLDRSLHLPSYPSKEFKPQYYAPLTYPTAPTIYKNPISTWAQNRLYFAQHAGDSGPGFLGEPPEELVRRAVQEFKNSFHNADKEILNSINYNPRPGASFFQNTTSNNTGSQYLKMKAGGIAYGGPREFITLDIETNDYNKPITISALKQVFNKSTGQFETVDSYQRFYNASNKDLIITNATHNLSHAALAKLRKQQGAKYASTYDDDEKQLLKDFLGSSIIVGHNIVDYDLRQLFPGEDIHNQTIDTLIAARNIWKDDPNGLDEVFKRIFGKTMSQAGLPHHDSMSDVIATAMIAQALMGMDNTTSASMRYVSMHPNVHLSTYDAMLDSQISYGPYTEITQKLHYIQKGDRVGMENLFGTDPDDLDAIEKKIGTGMHETSQEEEKKVYAPTPMGGGDASLILSSLSETAAILKETALANGAAAQNLKLTQDAQSTYGRTRMLRTLAGMSTETDMRKYLKANQYEEEAWDKMIQDARLVRETMVKGPSRLEKLAWGAQREGYTGFAKRFRGLDIDNADIYEIWEAEADYKEFLRSVKEDEAEDKKQDTAWENFYKKRNEQAASLIRYGYSEEDVEDIANATSPDKFADALAAFKLEQRKQHEERVAIRNGQYEKARRISETQTELELDKLNDEFTQTTSAMNVFQKAILSTAGQLNKLPTESYQNVLKMQQSQVDGVLNAASGVVPNFILKPMGRFANAYMNFARSGYAKTQFAWDTMHYGQDAAPVVGSMIGGTAGGITGGPVGAIVGSSLGAGIGTGVAGLGNLFESAVTYFPNKWREKQLTQYGEAIQGKLNLLGGYAEIISTPFRILANVSKLLSRNFLSLNRILSRTITGGLDAYGNMGSPLTPLTGVNYGSFEKTAYIDILTNTRRGTTNNAYESFAQAQQDLYWGGRFNQSRLTAASLLGVFGDVYANGGDTRAQYAHMVNKLYKDVQHNPSQRQFILGQASIIDNQLPQILSYMERAERYLGRSVSYESLQNAETWGVYKRDLSDRESDRFYGYRMERGIIKGSFENTKMRFAGLIWDSFGRDIMDGLNKALDNMYVSFAQSKFITGMKALADDIKNQRWGEVWSDVKSAFLGGLEDIKKMLGGIEFKLDLSGLKDSLVKGLTFINDAWWSLIAGMTKSLSGLIDYINTMTINADAVRELFKKGHTDKQILNMGYNQASKYVTGTYADLAMSYGWFGESSFDISKGVLDPTTMDAKAIVAHLDKGSDLTILGQKLGVGNWTDMGYYRKGSKIKALQTLMDTAASNNWRDPYKAVGWLTSIEGRDTYETLFNAEQRAAIEESYQPKWLQATLDTLYQLRDETDLNIANVIDKLAGALEGIALKVQVDNKIDLNVSGDAKKVSENKGVIPNLLSFTINGKSTAGYAGNLVQKLTAASIGGK